MCQLFMSQRAYKTVQPADLPCEQPWVRIARHGDQLNVNGVSAFSIVLNADEYTATVLLRQPQEYADPRDPLCRPLHDPT